MYWRITMSLPKYEYEQTIINLEEMIWRVKAGFYTNEVEDGYIFNEKIPFKLLEAAKTYLAQLELDKNKRTDGKKRSHEEMLDLETRPELRDDVNDDEEEDENEEESIGFYSLIKKTIEARMGELRDVIKQERELQTIGDWKERQATQHRRQFELEGRLSEEDAQKDIESRTAEFRKRQALRRKIESNILNDMGDALEDQQAESDKLEEMRKERYQELQEMKKRADTPEVKRAKNILKSTLISELSGHKLQNKKFVTIFKNKLKRAGKELKNLSGVEIKQMLDKAQKDIEKVKNRINLLKGQKGNSRTEHQRIHAELSNLRQAVVPQLETEERILREEYRNRRNLSGTVKESRKKDFENLQKRLLVSDNKSKADLQLHMRKKHEAVNKKAGEIKRRDEDVKKKAVEAKGQVVGEIKTLKVLQNLLKSDLKKEYSGKGKTFAQKFRPSTDARNEQMDFIAFVKDQLKAHKDLTTEKRAELLYVAEYMVYQSLLAEHAKRWTSSKSRLETLLEEDMKNLNGVLHLSNKEKAEFATPSEDLRFDLRALLQHSIQGNNAQKINEAAKEATKQIERWSNFDNTIREFEKANKKKQKK